MPTLTRWFLKTAMLYFLVSFGLSGVLLMALGVCYWIFPRFGGGASHGNTTLAWFSYVMLNVALGLVICHLPIQVLYGSMAANLAFAGAGVLQSLAALPFVLHIWPRIRASAASPQRR